MYLPFNPKREPSEALCFKLHKHLKIFEPSFTMPFVKSLALTEDLLKMTARPLTEPVVLFYVNNHCTTLHYRCSPDGPAGLGHVFMHLCAIKVFNLLVPILL